MINGIGGWRSNSRTGETRKQAAPLLRQEAPQFGARQRQPQQTPVNPVPPPLHYEPSRPHISTFTVLQPDPASETGCREEVVTRQVQTLLGGGQIFPNIAQKLDNAKKSIYISSYEMQSPDLHPSSSPPGTPGAEFQATQLYKIALKSKQGLDVRVLFDNSPVKPRKNANVDPACLKRLTPYQQSLYALTSALLRAVPDRQWSEPQKAVLSPLTEAVLKEIEATFHQPEGPENQAAAQVFFNRLRQSLEKPEEASPRTTGNRNQIMQARNALVAQAGLILGRHASLFQEGLAAREREARYQAGTLSEADQSYFQAHPRQAQAPLDSQGHPAAFLPVEKRHNDGVIQLYRDLGLKVRKFPTSEAVLHHFKLLLVDGEQAVAGGMNWGNHSPVNKDYCQSIQGADVRKLFHQSFGPDWEVSGEKRLVYLDKLLASTEKLLTGEANQAQRPKLLKALAKLTAEPGQPAGLFKAVARLIVKSDQDARELAEEISQEPQQAGKPKPEESFMALLTLMAEHEGASGEFASLARLMSGQDPASPPFSEVVARLMAEEAPPSEQETLLAVRRAIQGEQAELLADPPLQAIPPFDVSPPKKRADRTLNDHLKNRLRVYRTSKAGREQSIGLGLEQRIQKAKYEILTQQFVLVDQPICDLLAQKQQWFRQRKADLQTQAETAQRAGDPAEAQRLKEEAARIRGVKIMVDEGLYDDLRNCRPQIERLNDLGLDEMRPDKSQPEFSYLPMRFFCNQHDRNGGKLHAKAWVFDPDAPDGGSVLNGSANISKVGLRTPHPDPTRNDAVAWDSESEDEADPQAWVTNGLGKVDKSNNELSVLYRKMPEVTAPLAAQFRHDMDYRNEPKLKQRYDRYITRPVSWAKGFGNERLSWREVYRLRDNRSQANAAAGEASLGRGKPLAPAEGAARGELREVLHEMKGIKQAMRDFVSLVATHLHRAGSLTAPSSPQSDQTDSFLSQPSSPSRSADEAPLPPRSAAPANRRQPVFPQAEPAAPLSDSEELPVRTRAKRHRAPVILDSSDSEAGTAGRAHPQRRRLTRQPAH